MWLIFFRIRDCSKKVPSYIIPCPLKALNTDLGWMHPNYFWKHLYQSVICYCNKYQDRQVIKRKGSFWLTVLKVPVHEAWPCCFGPVPTFPDGSVQIRHTSHLMTRKQEWERMMNGLGTLLTPLPTRIYFQ